jgi:hypothetical protein
MACMLILWDPVNGPHTTDRTPGTVTLRHPGNHCRSNQVGHPPGCQSTTVPPQANQAHRQERGPSTAHASSPPRGSRGGRSPKTAYPPVDTRLRDPGQPGADGNAREKPPPHDPRTQGPWMLVPPGFHRFSEAVTTRRKQLQAIAHGYTPRRRDPRTPTGSPDDEQESLHRKRGGVRSPKTAHPPVDTRCRGPSQKRGGRGPGHK